MDIIFPLKCSDVCARQKVHVMPDIDGKRSIAIVMYDILDLHTYGIYTHKIPLSSS